MSHESQRCDQHRNSAGSGTRGERSRGTLSRRPDLALYAAKANGRNDFQGLQDEKAACFPPQTRAERAKCGRKPVARREFELHYSRHRCRGPGSVVWPSRAAVFAGGIHRGVLVAPVSVHPACRESTGPERCRAANGFAQDCRDCVLWPSMCMSRSQLISAGSSGGRKPVDALLAFAGGRSGAERLELEITESVLLRNTRKRTWRRYGQLKTSASPWAG